MMNAKTFTAMFFSFAICICLNAIGIESNSEQEQSQDAQKNMKALAESNANFAFKLYSQIRNADGNIFVSPFSISTALAMTYAGARGETEKEMQEALSFKLGQMELHSTFSRLLSQVNSINSQGKC
ncbi:MAG: serpin family protein, partial [Candidatus Nanoarchaeia archaeon]